MRRDEGVYLLPFREILYATGSYGASAGEQRVARVNASHRQATVGSSQQVSHSAQPQYGVQSTDIDVPYSSLAD